MHTSDLEILACPSCKGALTLDGPAPADGTIESGLLSCPACARSWPIRRGIPRFVEGSSENPSWDFKWHEIDRGRGINYRIIDKSDPAYEMHDIFDRNNHDGLAFQYAAGRIACDLGCGVGQYSIKLLNDYQPDKIVSVDLTRSVDIFCDILHKKFPQHKERVLIVQASIFDLPFRDQGFDYVMSLGVLHHTGHTQRALESAMHCVKPGGQLNVWLYSNLSIAIDTREGRRGRRPFRELLSAALYVLWVMPLIRWINRRSDKTKFAICKAFSSPYWLKASRARYLGRWASRFFPVPLHSDQPYRLLNIYDGYVNNWAETWDEHELFPLFKDNDFEVLGLSAWRTGFWARKRLPAADSDACAG